MATTGVRIELKIIQRNGTDTGSHTLQFDSKDLETATEQVATMMQALGGFN